MRSLPRTTQFALFHPPRRYPSWDSLPAPVRQQLIQLLARLMREHRTREIAKGQREEAGHE
jgi:hypothetical protein